MRVFLAGGSGVMGAALIPKLLNAGHAVTAMTRSESGADRTSKWGAEPVVCDAFDSDRLRETVSNVRPQVLINQLTNIPRTLDPSALKEMMKTTNRLRTEGTRNLVQAASAAGVERLITQSVAFIYKPTGDSPASEDDALYEDAPGSFAEVVQAADATEQATLNAPGMSGIALRYGYWYGPGTAYAPDGSFCDALKKKHIPLVGSGSGVFSFIHVRDAAEATLRAVESEDTGIFNIVDDDPAPVSDWLPYLADLAGAPRPMKVPEFLAKLGAGEYAVYLMTRQRGASNRRAKGVLGWTPRIASWREGFSLTFHE